MYIKTFLASYIHAERLSKFLSTKHFIQFCSCNENSPWMTVLSFIPLTLWVTSLFQPFYFEFIVVLEFSMSWFFFHTCTVLLIYLLCWAFVPSKLIHHWERKLSPLASSSSYKGSAPSKLMCCLWFSIETRHCQRLF